MPPLHDQGKDMRKWDGEPTSKLEARVHELREKTAAKKGPSKKALSPDAVGMAEGNQLSPRHRRSTENASLDFGEGTSGLTLEGADSEYTS